MIYSIRRIEYIILLAYMSRTHTALTITGIAIMARPATDSSMFGAEEGQGLHVSTILWQLHVKHSSSSSLGSRCVPWFGEGLSMPSPNYPVLCCPLPYRIAPVFIQVVSPPIGWSPLSSFLVIWPRRGDTRGPSVVFEAADMPSP